MSDKGGESESEIKDFESNMSAAELEARARVESAESASIDKALAEEESDMKEKEHRYYNASKVRLAVMTIFGTLLGACFIFFVVLFAMRLGTSEFFKEDAKKKDQQSYAENYTLNYKEFSMLYGLNDRALVPGKSVLFQEYGDGGDSGFTVITRTAQLNRLQSIYQAVSGAETSLSDLLELDEDFFKSGSIIAISVEDTYIGSLQTIDLARDEEYNITIKLKRTDIEKNENEEAPRGAGYLNLIKIDNVQPREVTIYIDN